MAFSMREEDLPGAETFNVATGVPDATFHEVPRGALRYSRHARDEGVRDRYGAVHDLPPKLTQEFRVVEAVYVNGRPVKKVIRGPVKGSPEKDLVLVVLLEDLYVKTVWINLKSDSHKTLKRDRLSHV